jgi:nucleoside-diphosphate-sugar epimerase
MKRLLITGATGFIGRHCVDAFLNRDFEMHAISSRAEMANSEKISWHRLDLHNHSAVRDLLATLRPSHLLHSAWYIQLGNHWSSTDNLRWVNSSLHLAEEFINHGGEKLICLGTCAEYDWSQSSCSVAVSEENTPLNPHTVYGASKAGLFMMLKALCKAKDTGFIWARPFGPYGCHDNPKRLIPHTVLSLLHGENMVCNNPEFVRNFTFVEDVAQILVEIMDKEIFGPVNIANGQAVKLKYVVDSIAKLLGAENLVQYNLGSGSTNEPPLLIADVKKLKVELGHIASTSLEDGLEKSVAWWRGKSGTAKKSIVSI